ncbi:MAG: YgjV family protein [Lachnospiraceae bacterium]|nr:YgjV family protein [Lachnospiraceae bacterium]
MDSGMIIEMIGYLGSVLVLISFLMSSVVKLRVINAVGSLVFAGYALIIHSYPTALMNFCLVGINIYYLVRLRHPDRQYTLMRETGDGGMLTGFLDYYRGDIENCFPGIRIDRQEADAAYLICHNMTPAGVLLGRERERGTLEILLDYSTPEYRDCSVGKYLYGRLQEQGFCRLVFPGEPGKHEDYLKRMGFVREDSAYVKSL